MSFDQPVNVLMCLWASKLLCAGLSARLASALIELLYVSLVLAAMSGGLKVELGPRGSRLPEGFSCLLLCLAGGLGMLEVCRDVVLQRGACCGMPCVHLWLGGVLWW